MSQPINLVILAAGGHSAEVYSYLQDLATTSTPVNLIGIIDEVKPAGPWEGTEVLGGFSALAELVGKLDRPLQYHAAVGNNVLRRELARKAEAAGTLAAWTLRHPSAQVGRGVEIGAGTLLAPNVVVTTRVRIGRHCILNAKASVHHDCTVGDYVNMNPGATVCGNVRLGDGVFLGAGATVINGVTIGEGSVIGAGSVVTKDVPAWVTAVGVPARTIKRHLPAARAS